MFSVPDSSPFVVTYFKKRLFQGLDKFLSLYYTRLVYIRYCTLVLLSMRLGPFILIRYLKFAFIIYDVSIYVTYRSSYQSFSTLLKTKTRECFVLYKKRLRKCKIVVSHNLRKPLLKTYIEIKSIHLLQSLYEGSTKYR